MDYASILPMEPSDGMKQWIKGLEWERDLLIYRAGTRRDPMTGISEKCVNAACSACGHRFKLFKVEAQIQCCGIPTTGNFGFLDEWSNKGPKEVRSGGSTTCPHCGKKVVACHIGEVSYRGTMAVWPMEATRIKVEGEKDRLVLICWQVRRDISKDGTQTIQARPYEGYIVEEKKIVRCKAWKAIFFGHTVFANGWTQVKGFKDVVRDIDTIYAKQPLAEIIEGTTAEKSKLDLYMACKGVRFPIAYLRLWQRRPNVETLLTAGEGELLAGLIKQEKRETFSYGQAYSNTIPVLKEVAWKEKRPSRMLGMDREELRQAVRGGLDANGWRAYKIARAAGGTVTLQTDIKTLNAADGLDVAILGYGQNPERAREYLTAQNKRYGGGKDRQLLVDYWNMARQGDLDLKNRDVRWPQNLQRAHNQLAVVAACQKEDQKLAANFADRGEALEKFRFEMDGLIILPPHREGELLVEGKLLHHCVASYATSHAAGRTAILFIRRKEAPDMPYYTLELEEKTLTVRQNRGLRNCARTKEVKDFEETWLEWVRAGCKRDKGGNPILSKEKRVRVVA